MVDPNGEFPWLALAIFAAGTGFDVGFQMAFEGKSLHEVNGWRALASGATGLVGMGTGYVSGRAISGLGLTGARAFAAGAIGIGADFGVGVAVDHYLFDDSMGTALASNIIGFGFGEVFGYAASKFSKKRLTGAIQRGIGQFEQEFGYDAGSVTIGFRSREVFRIWELLGIPNKPVGSGGYFNGMFSLINKLPGGLRIIRTKDMRTQAKHKWPRLGISDLDIAWVTGSKGGVPQLIGDDELYDYFEPDSPSLGRFINDQYDRDIIQHGAHINGMLHNARVRSGQLEGPLLSGVDDISRAIEDVSLYGRIYTGNRGGTTGDFMTTFASLNPGLNSVSEELVDDLIYIGVFQP